MRGIIKVSLFEPSNSVLALGFGQEEEKIMNGEVDMKNRIDMSVVKKRLIHPFRRREL